MNVYLPRSLLPLCCQLFLPLTLVFSPFVLLGSPCLEVPGDPTSAKNIEQIPLSAAPELRGAIIRGSQWREKGSRKQAEEEAQLGGEPC